MRFKTAFPSYVMIASLALLAGCNKAADTASSAGDAPVAAASSAAESPPQGILAAPSTNRAPGVEGSMAPNVAFSYRDAFSLPAAAISDVQSKHVKACKDLGPDKCQVVSFSLDQQSDDEANGEAEFSLDHDAAYGFVNEAVDVVHKADGKLAKGSINGTNSGVSITDTEKSKAEDQARLDRLNQAIANEKDPDARNGDREAASELRQRLSGANASIEGMKKAVAKTPVIFTYATQGALSGGGSSFGKAASASWGSAAAVLSFAALILGLVLPWALLIGVPVLLIWLWRRHKANLQPAVKGAEATDPRG